ncbi:C-14 sterol reductase [Rhizoctonia solani]|uniref:C-14 sterol reductase n=1 Tax=Rhizoctonia solani TaxID=456999 RepID=A0A8H7IAE2_9AGAM|nr:C-14 sterol reductase [Rhizoctonia solani]
MADKQVQVQRNPGRLTMNFSALWELLLCGRLPSSLVVIPFNFVRAVESIDWWKKLFDKEATIAYAAWYAFTVAAWWLLPGDWVEGTELRTGGRIQYKINAFSTMLLALGLTFGWIINFGPQSFTFIYEHWVGLCTASLLNSFIQATWCYYISTKNEDIRTLALGGNSGNVLYDWFIGRELNPSIGSFDIKSFNELRPGLILWLLCNISSACEQVTRRGTWIPTDSMGLVLLFQGLYVVDALYNEPAIFTTMDITTDGFGFMLAVGDLAWVPFTYSLQARYLAFNHSAIGSSGEQTTKKTTSEMEGTPRVRRDIMWYRTRVETLADLSSLQTERGTRLLTSGWWGMCQHPNYLGDWIMSVSYSLPTGFNTPITYFYCIYFLILLLHRQTRDDEACRKKYGKDWATYTNIALHNWRLGPVEIVSFLSVGVSYLSRAIRDSSLSQLHPPNTHLNGRVLLQNLEPFPHWLDELLEGFNLLFYGVGSKRTLLNEFATEYLSAEGHVVVVNGYLPTVGPADILTSLEQIPGILDIPLTGSGAEARAHRIASSVEQTIFVVVHNIDASQLRTARAQRVLSILASAENVHLVGTVDHVNSGLLFPRDQALGRKAHLGVLGTTDDTERGRGFKSWAWLWHDLTTFEPYTAELSHRDLTIPPSTSSAAAVAAPTLTASEVTPSAAQHVFASVTAKAQKVFFMLGQRQLRSLEEEGVVRIPAGGMQKYAVPYDSLLAEARDEFVAANDAALRGLLGEFKDHGMVLSGEAEGGGEVLWVPASQDILKTILGYLSKMQPSYLVILIKVPGYSGLNDATDVLLYHVTPEFIRPMTGLTQRMTPGVIQQASSLTRRFDDGLEEWAAASSNSQQLSPTLNSEMSAPANASTAAATHPTAAPVRDYPTDGYGDGYGGGHGKYRPGFSRHDSQPGFPIHRNRRLANPAPLGMFALAATTLMWSLYNARTRGLYQINAVIAQALAVGGLVQLLAGMWEFVTGNTFAATAFSILGGFWISYGIMYWPYSGSLLATPLKVNSGVRWFMVWMIVALMLFLGSLRGSIPLAATFFFIFLMYMLIGIAHFTGRQGARRASGILGCVGSFIGFYTGAVGLHNRDTTYYNLPALGTARADADAGAATHGRYT